MEIVFLIFMFKKNQQFLISVYLAEEETEEAAPGRTVRRSFCVAIPPSPYRKTPVVVQHNNP